MSNVLRVVCCGYIVDIGGVNYIEGCDKWSNFNFNVTVIVINKKRRCVPMKCPPKVRR